MLGFAPYLLKQSKLVFQGTAPSTKITPPGYTRMILENSRPNIVSTAIDDGSGHVRDVKIKYRTRLPKGKTKTTDTCDIDIRPAYTEATISSTMFRKLAIMLEDDIIAKYEADASANTNAKGELTGTTSLMNEQWDVIMEQMNGIMADINDDLITKQSTLFGKNQTTGSVASTAVNFPLSTTTNSLTVGMTKIMADVRANEIDLNSSVFVGSGLIDNYYLQMQQGAIDINAAGLKANKLALPKFYQDYDCASGWGANQFGIFEKNAVQFIDLNRNVGFKAGQKAQGWFGTLTVPILDSQGNVFSFKFDIQLKYFDCPTSLVINGYGEAQSVGRGWAIIISKSFDQFNVPADAYASDDRLYQNNGTLRYTAGNA